MKQNFWKIPTNISNTRQKMKHLPEVQAHAQPPTHAHTEEEEGNNKLLLFYNTNLQEGITYAGTSEFK